MDRISDSIKEVSSSNYERATSAFNKEAYAEPSPSLSAASAPEENDAANSILGGFTLEDVQLDLDTSPSQSLIAGESYKRRFDEVTRQKQAADDGFSMWLQQSIIGGPLIGTKIGLPIGGASNGMNDGQTDAPILGRKSGQAIGELSLRQTSEESGGPKARSRRKP